MGRGTIEKDLGEGRYIVKIIKDISTAEGEKARIENQITQLEAQLKLIQDYIEGCVTAEVEADPDVVDDPVVIDDPPVEENNGDPIPVEDPEEPEEPPEEPPPGEGVSVLGTVRGEV